MGASYFKNICSKCHLPSLSSRDGGFYYYGCKSMVTFEIHEAHIFCKIKQEKGDEYDCVLCKPSIKSLLGHDLNSLEDSGTRQGFFFVCLGIKNQRVDLH